MKPREILKCLWSHLLSAREINVRLFDPPPPPPPKRKIKKSLSFWNYIGGKPWKHIGKFKNLREQAEKFKKMERNILCINNGNDILLGYLLKKCIAGSIQWLYLNYSQSKHKKTQL